MRINLKEERNGVVVGSRHDGNGERECKFIYGMMYMWDGRNRFASLEY